MSKDQKYTFTTTRKSNLGFFSITKTIRATSQTQARYRFKNRVYKDWFRINKIATLQNSKMVWHPDWDIKFKGVK